MLNKEKYAKELLDIVCNTGEIPAVVNDKPCSCEETKCENCNFYNCFCSDSFIEWANSECVECEIDWTKVPVDTPVYVKDFLSGRWNKRHFYRFDVNSKLYYCYYEGQTSWSSEGDEIYTHWEQCKLAEGVDCSEWYKD